MQQVIKTVSEVKSIFKSERDYALAYYSDYNGVEDEKFHELLEKYRVARKELIEYIDNF